MEIISAEKESGVEIDAVEKDRVRENIRVIFMQKELTWFEVYNRLLLP